MRDAPPNGHGYRGFRAKAGLLPLNQFGITFTARLPTTITTAPSCKIQIAAQSGRGERVAAAGRYYQRNDADRAGLGDQHFAEVGFKAIVRQPNSGSILLVATNRIGRGSQ